MLGETPMDHLVTRTCLASLALACLVSCVRAPSPRHLTSSRDRGETPAEGGDVVRTTGLVLVLGSAGLSSVSIAAGLAMNDTSDTQAMGAVIALNAALGTLGIIGLVLATWDDGAPAARPQSAAFGMKTALNVGAAGAAAKTSGAASSAAATVAGGHATVMLQTAPSADAEHAVETERVEHHARLPGDADDSHRPARTTNSLAERHHRPHGGRVQHTDR